MELPRLIVVGEKNIGNFGNFLLDLGPTKKVSIIAGSNVQKIVKTKISKSLADSKIKSIWHMPSTNDEKSIKTVEGKVRKDRSDLIVGIGGGRSIDVAKMISFNLAKPFVSVPTTASHDGIASPFVSIKGEKPHSLVATAPLGVFVDIDIIKKAPKKLLAAGCGDLVAKITAVKDWQLGRDNTGEYYGRYSSNLASMSAKILLEATEKKKRPDIREIVEALISAGVASCIAGSSRPCSGSEHLFSHALDKLAPGIGLHGEKCGLGAILMAKLQGQDWKKIANTLKNVGAPTTAKQVGLDKETIAQALVIAQSLRPERYTILKQVKMTQKKALDLAKNTNVI
ncbi:MAG: iron-containing alcohol dehydrogenase [Nitrososphaeria archaeon]|nr:iron-containing alcohol dehydrogenase [Nitrososphaeria archaeon]NDB63194.1 iron-containing alcohol dehydrogenase [Nitrosopumilaceae archaeon]NDB88380.1 iron-containing alcohol dehydrogenase [Nitrososphaerota archaeon]NDB46642.1 iron-containing alcohol dehydrogenase [Nitrososphaeria archaeon]NDB90236.1 iron-containing alcohol dehydrogenase [Nitrososphaerota archaeon]